MVIPAKPGYLVLENELSGFHKFIMKTYERLPGRDPFKTIIPRVALGSVCYLRAPSIVVDMKEGHKIGLGRVKGKENT